MRKTPCLSGYSAMKRCKNCGKTKRLTEFSKARKARGLRPSRGGMGVASVCKYCCAELRKPGIHQQRTQERLAKETLAQRGLKECTTCREQKFLTDFSIRKASLDGLSYKCKSCVIEYSTHYRRDNPNAYKDWYQQNREHKSISFAKWREANKDRVTANYKAWAKANKPKVNSLIAKRTARKLAAVAAWINWEAVEAIYARASRLTKETGVRHEVDHIIPLQGKLVCGLHWEGNLQILTKTENLRKGNRFDIGAAA